MLTYSDFEKADDKARFVLSAISTYKNSEEYRVAERADVPLFDMAAQDMGRALVGFAEGTWQALFGFADAVSSAVSDCAEMCRRLTNDAD